MPVYRNLNELSKALDKSILSFLEKSGEVIKESVIKKYIMESFYEQYQPVEYERTFQLFDSVTCTKAKKISGNKYQITVYLNTDGVHYFSNDGSTVDPLEISKLASQGWHGYQIHTEPKFMEDAKFDLKNGITYNILEDFKKYLLKYGFKTVSGKFTIN